MGLPQSLRHFLWFWRALAPGTLCRACVRAMPIRHYFFASRARPAAMARLLFGRAALNFSGAWGASFVGGDGANFHFFFLSTHTTTNTVLGNYDF